MNDTAALTTRTHLVHDVAAVNRAKRLCTEKVLPDVRDAAAARTLLRRWTLNEF